jgi:hypothetical protein
MALAMFAGRVPCFFQLNDPSCPKAALWVAHFVHEENTSDCELNTAFPLCDEHRTAIQRTTSPFWRTWFQMDPWPCNGCSTPLRLDRFEALASDGGVV